MCHNVVCFNRSNISGLTVTTYDELFDKQNGRCGICGTDDPSKSDPRRKRFCIDHDHKTGKIRGLLCNKCNRTVGLFDDDIDIVRSALEYLSSTQDYKNLQDSNG